MGKLKVAIWNELNKDTHLWENALVSTAKMMWIARSLV